MRHLTDEAHVEAATADLVKNDEPGIDDFIRITIGGGTRSA